MVENNIEAVKKINNEWLAELEEEGGFCGLLMNQPFTDDYWKERYKIVFCNLETYGQPESTEKILNFPCFSKWLEVKNRTIKNTSLFIYFLYNSLMSDDINRDKLSQVKNDHETLLETIKKITYMNLLKDTNTKGRHFDEKYFWDFFKKDKDRKHTIDLINALSPNIFIVTGIGKDLIEQLFGKKFDENHLFVHNNTLFFSLGHPAMPTFTNDYIIHNVNMLKEGLKKYNLIKL